MKTTKLYNLLRDFKSDTRGNFGVMAATTVLGLISAIGLSVDGQRVYTHNAKTQSVADAAGLAAAIHASSNGGMVPTEGATGVFVEGQTYNAEELGFELTTGETITFKVDYDESAREVTVTTTGTVTPLMLQLIGKNEITTSASSTVKFQEPDDLKPASVLFVLDESGSMWFDDLPIVKNSRPVEAVRRVQALRDNMNSLNNRLRALGADRQSAPDNNFLRTGIVTFNNGPVTTRDQFGRLITSNEQGPAGPVKLVVPMDWKSISPDIINNQINPFGGTNSAPAITEAVRIMREEERIHGVDENGDPAAERYMIFMSDGQNSTGSQAINWRHQAGTGFFRRFVNENVCIRRNFFTQACLQFERRRVEQRWDVDIQGTSPPANQNWQEGVYATREDNQTVNRCNRLKDSGVNIYTIGFALREGEFFTNEWRFQPGGNPFRFTVDVDREDLRRAVSLLRACATDDSTFLLANDAEQLEIAFEQIGVEITESIVRLTN